MKRRLGLAAVVVAFALVSMGCQPEVEQEHVHTFSDTWIFDESSHWHEATCGHDEKSNLKTHKFSTWKTVADPTEDKDGSKERKCSVCGYKETGAIPALGHHHQLKPEWSSDESSHWHVYDCGRPEHFEDKAGHSYGDWISTDDRHWKECSECGRKIVYDHSYGDWAITDNEHWRECDECGRKIAKSHSYKWMATEDKHWTACSVCGKKTEEANHNFNKGDYLNECVCGEKKAVSLDVLGTYDSTKMTFGVYPQTIKASGVTVDKSKKNTEITGADYYLGSDGAWYAECVEDGYTSGYKYSDGSTVAQKSAYRVKYFKVEPIEWVYLAETKCLLAKKILTANVQWHASSINYKNSNIRSWLNGTFYNSAFTENQKKKIKTTTVDNSVDSMESEDLRIDANIRDKVFLLLENTEDKVFLLSCKEAQAAGNGLFTQESRIKFPTDYALANYCIKHWSFSPNVGTWWLRSPFLTSPLCTVIKVDSCGVDFFARPYEQSVGVVPALSISE